MTPKQKAFVDAYLRDKNGTQAAIKAGYSEKTAHVIASENLKKPEIAEAIAKRQEQAAERAQITLESHLVKLAELRDKAIEAGQLSAAVKAEENRGKVAGLYTERVEHSGSIATDLPDEQREQRVIAILAGAKKRRQAGLVS